MHALDPTTIERRLRTNAPVSASPEEQGELVELLRCLPQCKLVGPEGEEIHIPEATFRILERVVELLARGDAITLVRVGKELTTQQAANILNVSRQYLVRLLDEGRIPFTKTGKHRRLRIEDVLEFKRERDRERRAGLDELTRMSEDAGGYQELK
ncbi:MAG: helix-turn-helix domain-containing protein [Deltaproteobacteria bacterium]|jgi:excisionase family DNA binding protein